MSEPIPVGPEHGVAVREPRVSEAPTVSRKADAVSRLLAGLIDFGLATLLWLVPFVGPVAGAAYLLVRDGLEFEFMRRRSVGKTLLKLRPVRIDGAPMDLTTSLRRNLFLAIPLLVGLIPLLGWLLAPPVAFVVLLAELLTLAFNDEGRRLGDRFGETRVIEAN